LFLIALVASIIASIFIDTLFSEAILAFVPVAYRRAVIASALFVAPA